MRRPEMEAEWARKRSDELARKALGMSSDEEEDVDEDEEDLNVDQDQDLDEDEDENEESDAADGDSNDGQAKGGRASERSKESPAAAAPRKRPVEVVVFDGSILGPIPGPRGQKRGGTAAGAGAAAAIEERGRLAAAAGAAKDTSVTASMLAEVEKFNATHLFGRDRLKYEMQQVIKSGGIAKQGNKMPATMRRGIIAANHVVKARTRMKQMAEGTYVKPKEDLSKKGASKDDLMSRTRFGEMRGGVFHVNMQATRDHERSERPPPPPDKLRKRVGGGGIVARKQAKKKAKRGKR